MKTIGIRMLSGEQLVAELKGEGETYLDLENPAVIILQGDEQQGVSVQFRPMAPFAKGKVTLDKTGLMTFDVVPELEKEYIRIFSGIEIVSASNMPK